MPDSYLNGSCGVVLHTKGQALFVDGYHQPTSREVVCVLVTRDLCVSRRLWRDERECCLVKHGVARLGDVESGDRITQFIEHRDPEGETQDYGCRSGRVRGIEGGTRSIHQPNILENEFNVAEVA